MPGDKARSFPAIAAGILGFALGLAVAAIVTPTIWRELRSTPEVDFQGSYHAVLLTNGQAYFGRLEERGNRYLRLSDVYYVQTAVNPETKESTNALVKRGNEIHGPNRMVVNLDNVLFIEPVGPSSEIGKLIAEREGKP